MVDQFVDFISLVNPVDSAVSPTEMRVQPEPLTRRDQRPMCDEELAWECYRQALRHWEREGGWWRFVSNVDSSTIAGRLNAPDNTTEMSSEAEEQYLTDRGCYRSAASQVENEASNNETFLGMTFHGMTEVICDLMTDDEFSQYEATSPERRSAIMTKLVELRVQQITEQDMQMRLKAEYERKQLAEERKLWGKQVLAKKRAELYVVSETTGWEIPHHRVWETRPPQAPWCARFWAF